MRPEFTSLSAANNCAVGFWPPFCPWNGIFSHGLELTLYVYALQKWTIPSGLIFLTTK